MVGETLMSLVSNGVQGGLANGDLASLGGTLTDTELAQLDVRSVMVERDTYKNQLQTCLDFIMDAQLQFVPSPSLSLSKDLLSSYPSFSRERFVVF